MKVLTEKSYKDYTYTSRYASIPYYYNSVDERYVYGIGKVIDKNTSCTLYYPDGGETLDYIAFKQYGRPDLYWIIADRNNIADPYTDLGKYKVLYVPTLSDLAFKED